MGLQAVGQNFKLATMQKARAMAWDALDRTQAAIEPGMREADAIELGEQILDDMGMEHPWHPLLVRFGANTLNVFSDRSDENTVLGKDDIYFIDMGPVFDGHEGDAGQTFVTGDDPEMAACAAASKILFDRVRGAWDGGKLSGIDLYEHAAREAEAMGWMLNLEIKGHRVSDYPHSIHKDGKLGAFAGSPNPALWVLEIQIRHPTRPFGAFYEDLLA